MASVKTGTRDETNIILRANRLRLRTTVGLWTRSRGRRIVGPTLLVAILLSLPNSGLGRNGNANAGADHSAQWPRRNHIKWLINTASGDFQRTRAPLAAQNHSAAAAMRCPEAATITRLQMIRGGTVAVLVMPSSSGAGAPFSLGYVNLEHGYNNVYPPVRPFPDWQAFSPERRQKQNQQQKQQQDNKNSSTADPPKCDRRRRSAGSSVRRIVNAVDAFLDSRGRYLWVLDTGTTSQNACRTDSEFTRDPPTTTVKGDGDGDGSGNGDDDDDDDDDRSELPKFLTVDVLTNRIVGSVSLERVWKPGISCFQHIIAVYPDSIVSGPDDGTGNEMSEQTDNENNECLDWPLVVISDAGTNRLLVYSHESDGFTKIMLPKDRGNNWRRSHSKNTTAKFDEKGTDPSSTTCSTENPSSTTSDNENPSSTAGDKGSGEPPEREWPTRPIRDILYLAPLSGFEQPSAQRVLVTYHGCQEVYKLGLHPSANGIGGMIQTEFTGASVDTTSMVPITATLKLLARKPCRMVVLGTDRRRFRPASTGAADDYQDGGTTVYFRLGNKNDIWSWDASKTQKTNSKSMMIDMRDFRLIRLGETCRVPVAVSAAPAVASGTSENAGWSFDEQVCGSGDSRTTAKKTATFDSYSSTGDGTTGNRLQLLWMLETNFVDHLAGTTDRLGANAKLQPLEVPPSDGLPNDKQVLNAINSMAPCLTRRDKRWMSWRRTSTPTSKNPEETATPKGRVVHQQRRDHRGHDRAEPLLPSSVTDENASFSPVA